MVFTGKMIDAKTAYEKGLVNKVVPPERLMEEAKALAKELASKAPVALKLCKMLIDKGLETDLDTALALETEAFGTVASTEDLQEGVSAFLEKRKPEFKGK